MAAKVVMVAVPTVLGIASLRVYSIREAPVDGPVTRDLPIYTPSSQYRFVAEKPGALESGVTTLRESLLPFVLSVKDLCVSVKRGSIQVYQTGENAYHYLKDPPPGFLPRLGTITTAGMLGMILARKGSHFKRVAVPLGMMGAGASLCYPAQTVAVLKVSGRRLYAACQWSGATVSSLFASKPTESVADALVTPVPQTDAGPKPETPTEEESPATPRLGPDVTASISDGSPQAPPASDGAPTVDSASAEPAPLPQEPPAPAVTEEPAALAPPPPAEAPASESTAEAVLPSVPVESTPVPEESPVSEPVNSLTETESTPVSVNEETSPQAPSPAHQTPAETTTEIVGERGADEPSESTPAPTELPCPDVAESPIPTHTPPTAPEETSTEEPTEIVGERGADEPSESTSAPTELPCPDVGESPIPTHTPPTAPEETSTEEHIETESTPVSVNEETSPQAPSPAHQTPAETTTEIVGERGADEPSESTSAPTELPCPDVGESLIPTHTPPTAPEETSTEDPTETESTPVSVNEETSPQAPSPAHQTPAETTTEIVGERGADEPSESTPAPTELPCPDVGESPIPTHTPPTAPEETSTEDPTGGAGFQADPALMDFGQSCPDDEDLYSTRS